MMNLPLIQHTYSSTSCSAFHTRWRSIHLSCSLLHTFITGVVALTAADVPQLRSISLHFEFNTDVLSNSDFFTIPTMEHLTLKIRWGLSFDFTVDWTLLTSLTLGGCRRRSHPSATEIAGILQRTRHLSICDISIGDCYITNTNHPGEINLPVLKVLYIDQGFKTDKYPGILDLINAPMLDSFHLQKEPFAASTASAFFMRSPNIRDLSLCYADSLTEHHRIAEPLPYTDQAVPPTPLAARTDKHC